MRVALIHPTHSVSGLKAGGKDYYGFPLGLGYLAAVLLQAGHETAIFDPEPGGTPPELLWKRLADFRPDIVGLTCVTGTYPAARAMAAEAKRLLGRPVIMGGVHATALPRSTLLGTPGLDAVIRGEGETAVLALARGFDESGRVDFSAVPGAAYQENGVYRENPPAEPLADLDSLPYPARELVDLALYQRTGGTSGGADNIAVLSSRGCPSACTFCANICMGRKFRPRSPENFVAELESLRDEHGARHFKIVDDCFTADPARLAAICGLILERRLGCTWEAAGRVNNLRDEALLQKMKSAGCRHVLLGIESGSPRVLELMRKNITPEAAQDCCAKLRRAGISYINTFILGAEGETEETARETLKFSRRLKSVMAEFLMLVPYPGTPLFDKFYKDYDRPDADWAGWCSPGPERPYPPRQTTLSWARLRRLQLWGYLRFYLRPAQLARVAAYAFKL